MKKMLIGPLIMLGACAACCTLPLVVPLMTGLLASGIGTVFGGWKTGLAVVTSIAVLTPVLMVRRKTAETPSANPCQAACPPPQDVDPCSCKPHPQR